MRFRKRKQDTHTFLVLTIEEAMKYYPDFFGGDKFDNWYTKEIWNGITTEYLWPWCPIRTEHVIVVWNSAKEMVGFCGFRKNEV